MATKDVEMSTVTEQPKTEEKPPAPIKLTPAQEIKANIALIQRGVSSMEPRFSHRVLRTLTGMRKQLNAQVVTQAITENLVKGLSFYFIYDVF